MARWSGCLGGAVTMRRASGNLVLFGLVLSLVSVLGIAPVSAVSAPSVGFLGPNPRPTAGGTRVTVFGSSLTGTTAVHFGASLGTSLTNVSPTEVDVTSPAHAAAVVDVTVTTAFGTSSVSDFDLFTYDDKPHIFGLGP